MNENDHSAVPGPEHTGARRRRRPRRRVSRPAGSLAVTFSDVSASHNAGSRADVDAGSSPDSSGSPENADQSSPREELESALHDLPSLEEAPFAAVSISTSGIHPKTSRLVALSVVFFGPGAAPTTNNAASVTDTADLPTINIGQEVTALTRHLNPGEDAGPWHLHGYQVNELSQALGFNSSAQLIHQALDGRTLIMHESDYVWGFLTHEFKLVQRSANRGRRSRGRGRGGRRIPMPAPVSIIDTLATARRQAIDSTDPRLRAIVASYGIAGDASQTEASTGTNASGSPSRPAVHVPATALPEVGAAASLTKKEIDPDALLEANARLTAALAVAQQRGGELTVLDPEDLAADQFGLRRSGLRIDAANSPRPFVNPGVWKSGEPLVEGMEFVVSPDVAIDPDELIGQGVAAGLAYSEKLNRRSSLVVCNENYELRGKAMHADRKSIPLVRDEDFLALLANVQPGEKEAKPTKPGAGARPRTSGLAGPRGGSGAGGSGSSGRGAGGSGSGKSGKSKKSNKNGRSSNSGHKGNATSGGHEGQIPDPSGKRNRRRRRRRKSSGGSANGGN